MPKVTDKISDNLDDELKRLRNRRRGLKAWLVRGKNEMESLMGRTPVPKDLLRVQFDSFVSRLSSWRSVQSSIEELIDDETELFTEVSDQAEFDGCCAETLAQFSTVMPPIDSTASVSPNKIDKSYKLPKVDIPVFKGELLQWLPFIQSFENAVGQLDIPDNLKLTILRNHVHGEALDTIRWYSLIDDNYNPALSALKQKYGEGDRLIDAYIEELLNLRTRAAKLTLRQVYDQLMSVVCTLEHLKVSREAYAVLLVPMLRPIFSHEVKVEWAKYERRYKSSSPVTNRLTLFLDFLRQEVEIQELAGPLKKAESGNLSSMSKPFVPKQNKKYLSQSPIPSATFYANVSDSRELSPCPFCLTHHHPDRCGLASKFSPSEALALIKRDKRCVRCFGPHKTENCKSDRSCLICGSHDHHPVLCHKRSAISTARKPVDHSSDKKGGRALLAADTSATKSQAATSTAALISTARRSDILLQTAAVTAVGPNCASLVRCVLDSGSQRTHVTRDLVEHLGLHVIRHDFIISQMFGGHSIGPTHVPVVEIRLQSRYGFGEITVEALVNDVITTSKFSSISNEHLDLYPHFRHLQLADSPEYSDLEIGILIGLDNYWNIIGSEIRHGPPDTPAAISSVFGWIISGRNLCPSVQSDRFENVVNLLNVTKHRSSYLRQYLHESVNRFFELEGIGIASGEQSNNDYALQSFRDSIKFTGSRYSVGLPWKPDHPPLQCNYIRAKGRLDRLEKKLINSKLFNTYNTAMQEFVDSGYVESNLSRDPTDCSFYLPHRPVVKDSSATYKVRPVFDASAKGENNISLNDCLLVGPSLISDLIAVFLRFRQWRLGLVGDLRRAFLQIEVKESDRDVLRFLWKDEILRFTRVPFGVCSSPFLLNATIQHHINSQPTSSTEVSELLQDMRKNFYVDDYISGSNSVGDALWKVQTTSAIMADAGMDLRNWVTNSSSVYDILKKQDIHTRCDSTCLVLGVNWNIETDELYVRSVTWKEGSHLTKRNILSFVSQVFDPLGFLAPVIIRGKILLQLIWKASIPWDTIIVDTSIVDEAVLIRNEFEKFEQIKVPRWFFTSDVYDSTFHVFCDASQAAYSAAVYVTSGTTSSLVLSKTRVAPIKANLSLPRLELMGCLIGARLISHIKTVLPIASTANFHCWTDSTIALAWIKSSMDTNNRREVFITNRVVEIQSLTTDMTWHHVPTYDNPVDVATRPMCTIESLASSRLWWHGPSWLFSPSHWPSTPTTGVHVEDAASTITCTALSSISHPPPEPLFDLHKRSRLVPILRITAYALRWACRESLSVGNAVITTSSGKHVHVPSPEEIKRATTYWIKYTQSEYFNAEVDALKQSTELAKTSKLCALGPKLDLKGVIRSVGRTQRARRSESPVILPSKSPFTHLIVLHFHERLLHAGVTLTLAELSATYWLIRGQQTVRRVINKCLTCRRHKVMPYLQIPSALPEWRVAEQPPFRASGTDFAGPFNFRDGKAYILLFTCCSTRALHLEVTRDQSATSILNAFRRFVSRRGTCEFMMSDNAKSFILARQLLPDVNWRTIPERAPWWGGFWERFVRSIKNALRRCVGRAGLTFEELRTIAPEIEAVINLRPITYVSGDREDPRPLRPVDFLLTPGPPAMNSTSSNQLLTGRYKHQQAVMQATWKCWRKEYLCEIHRWGSSKFGKCHLQVGGDVLVNPQSHLTNRALFPLGIITECIPGVDGHVRVVHVRVQGKILRRSTRHLYPLETAASNDANVALSDF